MRILVIGGGELAAASPVATTIAALLKERGRDAEVVSVSPREDGLGAAVARGLEGGTFPLLLMTREGAIWNGSHIDALLDAIDHWMRDGGHMVIEDRRAIGRAHARNVSEILNGDRQTAKPSALEPRLRSLSAH